MAAGITDPGYNFARNVGDNFALQPVAGFGTFNCVRTIATFTTLVAAASTVFGQEQDRKLVDRILKPNMSLVNSAQNKQFGATATPVTKHASSRTFYTPDKSLAKSFPSKRPFSTGEFTTRQFHSGNSTASLATRSDVPNNESVYTSAPYDTRAAPEAGRSVASSTFSGSRAFRDRGKSQKAISARDTPLTIEQVRELLNKNK